MARHNRKSVRRGFSLIELVIVVVIIGIIAAIAIPRMSRGSAGAADSALAQNLALIRNAIDMYQTEHNGALPSGTAANVIDLLTKYSNADGSSTSTTKDTGNNIIYGPYLRTIPPAPVGTNKGKNGIAVSGTTGVDATADANTAWLYNSVDGTLKAYTGSVTTDSAGKAYSSY